MKTEQSTRDKILDAVYALIYEKGYNGTSMSMILKECGIPKGSLYHYFSSKKEMVLSVVRERLAPTVEEFYELSKTSDEHSIDTIIRNLIKISEKERLVYNGCPLNRLNQEMSPVDKEFEKEINIIYEKLKSKMKILIDSADLKQEVDSDSLADFIIATVWGNLSLSPKHSSKEKYLRSINHLISYLKSLKD